jgi:hypothetical protein
VVVPLNMELYGDQNARGGRVVRTAGAVCRGCPTEHGAVRGSEVFRGSHFYGCYDLQWPSISRWYIVCGELEIRKGCVPDHRRVPGELLAQAESTRAFRLSFLLGMSSRRML